MKSVWPTAGCRDITAEHYKRFFPRCMARDDIRCVVDENLWPNAQERADHPGDTQDAWAPQFLFCLCVCLFVLWIEEICDPFLMPFLFVVCIVISVPQSNRLHFRVVSAALVISDKVWRVLMIVVQMLTGMLRCMLVKHTVWRLLKRWTY